MNVGRCGAVIFQGGIACDTVAGSGSGAARDTISGMGRVNIRPAEPADVEVLDRFVRELAVAEEFPGEVEATPDDLAAALFGAEPTAKAVLATMDGAAVGFALYYLTYSTIVGRPTLHLEDLYVSSAQRGSGVGMELLRHLAAEAVARGCRRFEWWVLRTNEPAIRFYRRIGARELDEIHVMRLADEGLAELARTPGGTLD